AAFEEGKILWRREPIPEYLEKPDLGPDIQDKLKLVLAVREYARDVLKLNVGGSYSSYSYVDRPDLTYILTASPRTELRAYTWWFLIVGRVPYKGYFSKEEANAAAKKLEAEGYDTNIRTAAAFSTLGWFDDPLLSHLLRYDKVTLADVVFHELFHNTLYVKGAGHFNESVANFVGGRAAIDFFRDRFGAGSAEHERASRAWEEELRFAEFIEKLAAALNELYAREILEEEKLLLRQQVFARGKEEWSEWVTRYPTQRIRNFAKQPLNNAAVIHYMLYLKNLKLFEALYQAEGENLVRTIDAIREAVAQGGEPFEAVQKLLAQRTNQAVVKTGLLE
ncbi:MAG TPA: aminopeptidase, partial [Candidatus Binatia bacterium]|nr:aminopeptidase [Candidatus Binatia bacterium]